MIFLTPLFKGLSLRILIKNSSFKMRFSMKFSIKFSTHTQFSIHFKLSIFRKVKKTKLHQLLHKILILILSIKTTICYKQKIRIPNFVKLMKFYSKNALKFK